MAKESGFAINGIQVRATAAELNLLDGSTAGTQVAGKAVIADSNVNSGVSKVTAVHVGASGSEVLQPAALLSPTDLTSFDATALLTVGRYYTDPNGAVYVYLQGVANVAIGWVVSYIVTTIALATTKELITNAVGLVGVAMAATVAGKFGFFQVAGLNLATKCDTSAAIGAAYIGGTTGGVDDTAVLGDLIHGMQITVADASNVCGVNLAYPSVTNASGL